MNEVSENLLIKCSQAFYNVRTSVLEATALLYQVREQEAFKTNYTTFSDYVEQECGISRGHASKLLTNYEHYILKGGVSQQNLANIDQDKLYLATSLPGSVEEQVASAKTLTRSEIRHSLSESKAGEHEHKWNEFHFRQCELCELREKI